MLLTIKQVARELNISLSLAYRLVADGEIASYAIGSCKRVSEQGLQDYLDRQRREPPKRPQPRRRHF